MEARAAASASPCLFCCVVTSCYSSKVATARQRCGRQSNFGASFAHVSQLPEHWLQQSQPQRPRLLALERGSTTDLQPWSVRCVNKFIMCIVLQVCLDETFCRPPPPGLGNCPPLLYCRSQIVLLYQDFPWTGALGHLGADLGPGLQYCEHVNCFSSTFWFLSRPLELKVFMTRPLARCD